MSLRKLSPKILGIIVGIAFAYFGWQEGSELSRIRKIGKIATVEPIKNYSKYKSSGAETYTSEFTFYTEQGQKVTKKQSFPSELIKDFESGTPVKVLYNPANPNEFIFEQEKRSWLIVVAGVGIAIAALLFA